MNNNRRFAGLLAMLLIVSLAGCGSTTQTAERENSMPVQTAGETAGSSSAEANHDAFAGAGAETASSQRPAPTGSEQLQQEPEVDPAAKEAGQQAQPEAPPRSSSKPPVANPAQTQNPASTAQDTTPAKPVEPENPPAQTAPPQKTEPSTLPWVTQPPKSFTPADHDRIIAEVIAYAESYKEKGYTFVWDDSLEFSWESGTGWMGTPRVKYEGVDGVISSLKYHVDIIVEVGTDPSNGIPTSTANYKVMQVAVDGDIAFVVLYG